MSFVPLLLLALVLNAADAAHTCRVLRHGGLELNPLLGQHCDRIIAVKAATIGVAVLLPRRAKRIVLLGAVIGGGLGVTVSWALR